MRTVPDLDVVDESLSVSHGAVIVEGKASHNLATPTLDILSLNDNVPGEENDLASDIETVVLGSGRLGLAPVIPLQGVVGGDLASDVVVGVDGDLVSTVHLITSGKKSNLVSLRPV